MYYLFSKNSKSGKQVNYDTFFFPLDKIKNWNRIYGDAGFLQYQFVLPKSSSYQGIKSILELVSQFGGEPTLAVLKLFGKQNQNYLSFPMEGYSLALDFKNSQKTQELLNKLDLIVNENHGRIYLAKDSRQSADMFKKTYHFFEDWIEIKKELDPDCKFVSDISNRLDFFKNF